MYTYFGLNTWVWSKNNNNNNNNTEFIIAFFLPKLYGCVTVYHDFKNQYDQRTTFCSELNFWLILASFIPILGVLPNQIGARFWLNQLV